MSYHVGIDIGTGETKLVVLDDNESVVYHTTYKNNFPSIQQFPVYCVVNAVYSVLRKVSDNPEVDNGEVESIVFTSLGSSDLVLDENLKPISPVRTFADVDLLEGSYDEALALDVSKYTGAIGLNRSVPIWHARDYHSLGILEEGCRFVDIPTYLTYLLTGELKNSVSNMGLTGFLDLERLVSNGEFKVREHIVRAAGLIPEMFPEIIDTNEGIPFNPSDDRFKSLGFNQALVYPGFLDGLASYVYLGFPESLITLKLETTLAGRKVKREPEIGIVKKSFCYPLAYVSGSWYFVEGIASNNGGSVFEDYWRRYPLMQGGRSLGFEEYTAHFQRRLIGRHLPNSYYKPFPMKERDGSGGVSGFYNPDVAFKETERERYNAMALAVACHLRLIYESLEPGDDEILMTGKAISTSQYIQNLVVNMIGRDINYESGNGFGGELINAIGAALFGLGVRRGRFSKRTYGMKTLSPDLELVKLYDEYYREWDEYYREWLRLERPIEIR